MIGGLALLAIAGVAGPCDSRAWVGAPSEERPASERQLWVADRGAGRVLAFGSGLTARRSVPLEEPLRVASAPGGGVWVASGSDALVRLDRRGRELARLAVPRGMRVRDLASMDRSRELVVLLDGDALGQEVFAADVDGLGAGLRVPAGADWLAPAASSVLVGGAGGVWRLARVAGSLRPVASSARGGRSAGVLPALSGWGARWWMLSPDGGTLLFLEGDLSVVESQALPVPMVEGLAGPTDLYLCPQGRTQLLRVDPSRPRQAPEVLLDLRLSTEVVALVTRGRARAGVTLALPGALLEISGGGRVLRSLGGLVGVAGLAAAGSP